MKRIVWAAVAILVMLGILGFGLHTLNHIDEVNQKRREMQEGQDYASYIAMTTATTNVWDKVRTTTTVEVIPETNEAGEPLTDTEEASSTQSNGMVRADEKTETVEEIQEAVPSDLPEEEALPEGFEVPASETTVQTVTVSLGQSETR